MTSAAQHPQLPDWHVDTWLNTPHPLTLQSLRGRVVLIHAFQMLCPGCVATGLPQAQRVRQAFPDTELAVIGLHTVFEHHEAMNETALRAFVHEYRWSFPIGIDRPDPEGSTPQTMAEWGLRGTPSHIVLDRNGLVRGHHFGAVDDLVLGALLGRLVGERGNGPAAAASIPPAASPA